MYHGIAIDLNTDPNITNSIPMCPIIMVYMLAQSYIIIAQNHEHHILLIICRPYVTVLFASCYFLHISIPTLTYMEEECNNSCTLISRLRSMQGTQQQQLTILQQIGARLKIDNLGGALETSSVMMNPDQLSMYDNMTLGPPPSPMMARMGSTKGVEPSTSTATVELT